MDPETAPEPLYQRRATGIYRCRPGWRTIINVVIDVPGVGKCQRHVLKAWPLDTPLACMQEWRAREKARLQALWSAALRPPERARLGLLEGEAAALKAEIARLQQALRLAEARAASLEAACRRAYAFVARR